MKTWLLLLFLAALAVGSGADPATPSAPASPPPPGIRLLHADRSGLALEWIAPPVRVLPADDGTIDVIAEGYAQMRQPGAPRIPFASVLIVIPPGASPRLRVLSAEETMRPLPSPVALAPRPEGVTRDDQGRPVGGTFAPASVENQTTTRPLVVLEEVGIVRGVCLSRLTFYPASPEGGALRVIQRLHVEVSWETGGGLAWGSSDPLLERVRGAVLNPWDAVPAPRPITPAGLQPADVGTSTAFIEVMTAGLYRVTYEDLDGLDFADADPHNLRLFQGSEEVAYAWEGDDDAAFEPGEAVLFYGEPHFSRWDDVDAYRLVADATPGQRMGTRSADPANLSAGTPWVEQTAEENHIYTPDCFCGHLSPGRSGDRWVWEELRRPDRSTASFLIHTPAADVGQQAALTLWFVSYTAVAANPDHRVEVALNGASLGRVEWDGKTAAVVTLPIPAGVLRSGDNTLALTLPGIPGVAVEGAWLDGFTVYYGRSRDPAGASVRFGTAPTAPGAPSPSLPQRLYLPLVLRGFGPSGMARAYTVALAASGPYQAYDITDSFHPQRLVNLKVDGNSVTVGDPAGDGPHRYLLVGSEGVRRPTRVRASEDPWAFHPAGEPVNADILIITHPAFADALGPLVDLRQSQGFSTAVVNVLGIYDSWGDGRPAPEAIHAFIADAYATWDSRPAYVLLVGGGSFDPRRYRPESPPTFIPPYLADVDPWAGETAADNRYACVDGEDALPDLLLGRLPVQTAEEARTVVDKIVRYETDPSPGGWNASALLVADDADAAGDFAISSEKHAATYVTAPFAPTRHYCAGAFPYLSDCSAFEVEALHTALLNNWNRGALLVQFTGHASWQQWAAEQFFHLDDLAALRNGRRLPLVVEMTCFTGAFQRPEPTLDKDLVALPGGGAVAAWASTGLGVGTGHNRLSQGFFRAVFTDEAETLGEAALAGKLALVANGQDLDLLDTFTLLGDPALRLDRTIVPWAHEIFLPVTLRGS